MINTGQKGIYIAVYDTLGTYQYSINPNCSSAKLNDFVLTYNNELIVVGDYYEDFIFAGQNHNSPLGTNFFILSYDLNNQAENWLQKSTGSNTNSGKIELDSNEDIVPS